VWDLELEKGTDQMGLREERMFGKREFRNGGCYGLNCATKKGFDEAITPG
jgi:hypothetical protein